MTISPVTIRFATENDAELIADLSRATFYETFAQYNSSKNMELFLKEQFTRPRLIKEVGAIENTFLLAYHNKDVAGYVKLRQGEVPKQLKGTPALEIARIYVVRDFIGKGVGKELMQASIDIARSRKLEVVWLAVWENNDRAFKFYSSWGFEKFGTQVFLLGMDLQKDWLMKKELQEL
jgi:ribosomal protein S18 acetylase RimI-like enzyme